MAAVNSNVSENGNTYALGIKHPTPVKSAKFQKTTQKKYYTNRK